MAKPEKKFKISIKDFLEENYKGSILLNLDPSSNPQGINDTLFLYKNCWAGLEFKRSRLAEVRPNQPYWVKRLDQMSFSRFIFPENANKVMAELDSFLMESLRWNSTIIDL